MKPGRKDPCPCGSGKKYKKCCAEHAEASPAARLQPTRTAASGIPAVQEINSLIALFTEGRYTEAATYANRMTERFPQFGFGWKVLGAALQQMGRSVEALAAMQQAAVLLPDDAEAYGNLAGAFKKLGRWGEAEASYRRALQIMPGYAEAHYNLGIGLVEMGRLEEAAASFRRVTEIAPEFAEAHSNLGIALQELGRFAEAEAGYRRAVEIKPDFAEAHSNLAEVLQNLGRLGEAETSCRRALAIKPELPGAHNTLGNVLRDIGQLEAAEMSFRRAVELQPDFFEARFNLATSAKVKADDGNLAALAAFEASAQAGTIKLMPKDAEHLHYALAKSYADLGDHEQAFPHYLEGARIHRSTTPYDPDVIAGVVEGVMRNFNVETISRLRGDGDPSSVPIFILGMPRSGTSLIEQIIASHPDVHGAGELPDLTLVGTRRIDGVNFPDNVGLFNQAQLATWGGEYVEGLRRRAPDMPHITDKMPGNFLLTGLIHLMLPNAKIIHTNRNPVDTCLSCFTQRFSTGLECTYSLKDLGRYYTDYHRLMQHWRDVLPQGAFLDVQYEEVVADQEAQTRRIIDYCGLEWNDACLDFHNTRRAVQTASVLQVRQPIYKSSVERWRPYEKFLGPLFDALGDLAPEPQERSTSP